MTKVNEAQVKKVAEVLKSLPAREAGLNFHSYKKDGIEFVAIDMYPDIYHSRAINFFFFCCLYQHGFWYGDQYGYSDKFYGMINGKKTSGSDLI